MHRRALTLPEIAAAHAAAALHADQVSSTKPPLPDPNPCPANWPYLPNYVLSHHFTCMQLLSSLCRSCVKDLALPRAETFSIFPSEAFLICP